MYERRSQRVIDIVYGALKNIPRIYFMYIGFIGIIWLCAAMDIDSINVYILGSNSGYNYEMVMNLLLSEKGIYGISIIVTLLFFAARMLIYALTDLFYGIFKIDYVIETILSTLCLWISSCMIGCFGYKFLLPAFFIISFICVLLHISLSVCYNRKKIKSRYFGKYRQIMEVIETDKQWVKRKYL